MQLIHVKNLEKYHPGYQDRILIWCKLYFTTVSGDARFEMLEEIDKWRFLLFVQLELQNKRPIPYNKRYLTTKGVDERKRPIVKTLAALHEFIEIVTEDAPTNHVTENQESCNGKTKSMLHQNVEFELIWGRYPKPVGKKAALKSYESTVTTPEDCLACEKALDAYLDSKDVKAGFIQNGSTWFNNWRDWYVIATKTPSDGIPDEWRSNPNTGNRKY